MLTKQKLTYILRQVERMNVEIVNYSVKSGSEKGDNFASEMVRCDLTAKVAGQVKDYHWMVKLEPATTHFTKGRHFEENEIIFYSNLLPRWNQLAQRRQASFRLNSFAAPYTEFHEEEQTRSVLVMENLQCHGYTDAPNKKKGLSLDHAKVVLAEVARFHALGYVYLKNFPGGIKAGREAHEVFLTDYLHAKPSPGMVQLRKGMFHNIRLMVELIQEPGQDLVGILDRFHRERDVFVHLSRLNSPNPEGFNVPCHGDLWYNNMLFK